jgi:amino acid transporter
MLKDVSLQHCSALSYSQILLSLLVWPILTIHSSGVPYYCVLVTASISLLTYMSCSTGSNTVFVWFQNLTTIASLFTWCSICIACIKFNRALKAQGVDRSELIFKAPFQPYTAWFALVFFTIIIVFNGFYAFTPWSVQDFITAYVGIPIYFVLYFGWKIFKRTKIIRSRDADIFSGKAALDAVVWPQQIPRNFLERIWYWIA